MERTVRMAAFTIFHFVTCLTRELRKGRSEKENDAEGKLENGVLECWIFAKRTQFFANACATIRSNYFEAIQKDNPHLRLNRNLTSTRPGMASPRAVGT